MAVAGEGDQFDFAGVAGLEADGGAGGDVEAEAAGGGAIEVQGGVDFEEMEVAADLDGAVAGVGDGEGDELEAGVGFEGGASAGMISPGIMIFFGGCRWCCRRGR